ncbi:hypothetical protein KB236_00575 [Levilactobacillus brevis]|nr:hypothetical protein KB236_00575 [Levilactobacillus brevis]
MWIQKGLLKLAVVSAVAGLGLWGSAANASANSAVFWTGQDALDGAPQGVDLGSGTASDYFTIDNTVATASGTNSASLVKAGSPAGTGNSAIQISKAGDKQTWGSIWSKNQSFDLSKSETASMWIYASGQKTGDVGDGMAFVLQNGGTDVYSGPGQSMGVWGVADSMFTQKDPSASAIKNSWALEFDTYPNKTIPTQPTYDLFDVIHAFPKVSYTLSGNPVSYDISGSSDPTDQTPITDTHIASNYPGESSTYFGTKVFADGPKYIAGTLEKNWQGNFYYYGMHHEGLLDEGATGGGGNLSDHRWHHITVTYTPPTTAGGKGSMTYKYNDKNPDTGLPQDSTDYATVPIDLNKFNLSSGQSKVRWGFTGSTGDATENNLVIFDQIPGQAQTEATATLSSKDASNQSSSYQEVKSGGSVPGNSPIKLTYTFGRTDGDEDWKDVNAKLNIPSGLNITSGTISYPDASYKDSNDNKVDISKIKTSSNSAQTLDVPLANGGLDLSGTQHATITLEGTAKDIATDVSNSSQSVETSYFTGSNATSTAKTPEFTITPKVNSKLTMGIDPNAGTPKVNFGGKENAHVWGTAVAYTNTGTPDPSKASSIMLHPSINGVAQTPVLQSKIPITVSPYVGATFYFDYEIANSKLHAGNNTVSFYASYGSGDDEVTSTTVNTTVVAGTVSFGHTSGNMTFEPTTLTGKSTTVKRASDWRLDVDDTQTKDTPWKVVAQTTGMYLTKTEQTAVPTPLDGSLIYKKDKDAGEITLDNSATPVANGAASEDDSSTNIAQDWQDDSGILLKVDGNAIQGAYEGTITWSFVNDGISY